MPTPEINKREIRTLKEFYALMAETKDVRAALTKDMLEGKEAAPENAVALVNALESLESIPVESGRKVLALDRKRLPIDLSYEVEELKKDLLYIEAGETAFLQYLGKQHKDFERRVEEGVAALSGLSFNCFITDRDGTTNNYCGRYNSSIQSVYNAVFLTRFAKARSENPIFITSAPLADPGILDVSVNPGGAFIYGASKGREFLDLAGKRHAREVPEEKRKVLEKINDRLREMIALDEHEKFALIGSGLQFKFGQTTLARQDVSGSIPEDESLALLSRIHDLTAGADPGGKHLRIEDTGLDVEIILTIEGEDGAVKDFDKGDAVRYLAGALDLELARGPHLVCGDTASDMPMIAAVRAATPDVRSIFVTQKPDLADQVRALAPGAIIVPEPDMLVTILNALAS